MITHLSSDSILYEDNTILVVNKPAGLLSIQDGYDKSLPFLSNILSSEFGPLWIIHRLDRDTSGILVLARTDVAHRFLNIEFQNRRVEKVYHALVIGSPSWEEFIADFPLLKDGDRKHRTIIDSDNGKIASTEFQILEKYFGYSLIEARPKTGYTHQIRAHLAYIGFPVIFDSLYGRNHARSNDLSSKEIQKTNFLLNRLGLHSFSITFMHPLSGKEVSYIAPYPADFYDALSKLRIPIL